MKLAKLTDGQMTLVEVEQGHEIGGERTEAELYADGFKKACLTPKPSEQATEQWTEHPTCWVQDWIMPTQEEQPTDEISAEEALEIIIGG